MKKKEEAKMGRPLEGKEIKQRMSVRVEPRNLARIVRKFGSFSAFVNKMIKKEFSREKTSKAA